MKASAAVRFRFRYCLAMHDPHAARRLSAKDFQQWMWYEEVEPFGQLRDDYRTAQIVAMVHNAAVDSEHQKSTNEFLLKFGEPKRKRTPEEEARDLKTFIYALAGVKE